MLKLLKNISIGLIAISSTIFALNYGIEKKGGICFRTDDNYKIEDIQALKSVFDNYPNFHFSIALNFAGYYTFNNSIIKFGDASYLSLVQSLQAAGHEIMDHTPNHRTNYFITEFPASEYLMEDGITTISGVDNIVEQGNDKRKICLEFNDVEIPTSQEIGTCTIANNMVDGNFSSFDYNTDVYVYLEGYGLYFIYNFFNDKSQALIKNVWEENVDLGIVNTPVKFWKFSRANRLSIDGLKVLATEMQKIVNYYNVQNNLIPQINYPTTWIQPGGRHPILTMAELKEALEPLGYTAGASFVDNVIAGVTQALKVFNEYDQYEEKKFGMQWEDFNEDKVTWDLTRIKEKIADGIAKHKVLIGHNHFYDHDTLDFNLTSEYLDNVDSILNWCNSKSIEVKTYAEWADILYEQIPDPYQNVFPPLNVNLDDSTNELNPNGWPDGYEPRYYSSGNKSDHGIRSSDYDAPSVDHYYYSVAAYSRIFIIKNLGGIEKGENEFEIWTKGSQNDKIRIYFRFPNTSHPEQEFRIPADTQEWKKYTLRNSVNGNTQLLIPTDISTIEVELKPYYFNTNGDSIKVSGMYLAKKKPEIPIDLKILFEGPFLVDSMSTSIAFKSKITKTQPFTDPTKWNYQGTENFLSLPTNATDWVLVELRNSTEASSMETRKAGLVKKDGTIINADGSQFNIQVAEGSYYVVVYHRNHLPVMSSEKITLQ